MNTGSLIQYISLGSVLFGMVMLPGRVSLFQMRKEAWLKPLQFVTPIRNSQKGKRS